MLRAYHDRGEGVRVEDADLPQGALWLDLLDPSAEERAAVEKATGLRVPTEEALSEIEVSSRLIVQHHTLYLSTPAVARNEKGNSYLTPVGFVLTPTCLVTVRFSKLHSFDDVAQEVGTSEELNSSIEVFTAILAAMIEQGADALEHLGASVDAVSRLVFNGYAPNGRKPARPSGYLRQALTDIGISGDRLALARDVLMGIRRIANFVIDVGKDWIPEETRLRLDSISKDSESLNDYETHLSDKIQFLLDAVLGYISIEQNDIFKVLTVVSVVGIPPTLLAGIWGMNFKAMPELHWAWGYLFAWLAILASAVIPMIWLRRRGWF